MKRLFALSLTLLLLCSMASMALAVEFSHEMGGRFYGYFSTIDGDQGFNAGAGNDCWDTILGATVREGNTWAKISFKYDTWGSAIHHSLGIDNVGDTPLSLQFATYDTGTCNVGQQFMGDLFNDFKADPLFNTCDMGGSFSAKYITDTFEFKAEAKVYDGEGDTDNTQDLEDNPKYDPNDSSKGPKHFIVKENYSEIYAATFAFKPSKDAKVYFGAKHKSGANDDFFVVGTDLKLGEIGLKVDLWSDKGNYAGLGEIAGLLYDGKGYQALQATVDIGKTTGQLAVVQPESDLDNAIGLGAAYRLTEKLTLGTKYFMVDEAVCKDDLYDVYGMYKVGVFDIKVGASNAQFAYGQGGKQNAGSSGHDVDTKVNSDGFFYAGLHFEF